MDQTAFKNKILLGQYRERSKNPNMDHCIGIRISRNSQEEIYAETKPLRNPTGLKHIHFRKNAYKQAVSRNSITIFQKT